VDEQRIARQQLRQVLNTRNPANAGARCSYVTSARVPGKCGACDNCLEPRASIDRTLEAKQFLSCIARLAQRGERFGMAVRHRDPARRRDPEDHQPRPLEPQRVWHRQAPRARGVARPGRALLHQGLMTQSQDGFAVLSLNAASWQVLRGEQSVSVGESVKPAKTRKAAKPAVTGGNDELFEALRALRKRLADEAGMPPYIVFNDASLREMAQRQPRTLPEFSTIPAWARRSSRAMGEDSWN
jgi:ATP-dependent DNA helicase RecQ